MLSLAAVSNVTGVFLPFPLISEPDLPLDYPSPSHHNIMFIMVWNVAGEFIRPKNMTKGLNIPQFIRNAAFHSSPSLIRMFLKPQQTSIFENHTASLSLSTSSCVNGKE
uniref:Uncharacterized protein n=1 Tax=Moniliophthora roreri TaxID=221103 RepID=A0A0W0FZZ0_MONRR